MAQHLFIKNGTYYFRRRIAGQTFMKLEASAGIMLMGIALMAIIFANTGLAPFYDAFLNANVRAGIARFEISKPAVLWINDGLMAIFFFLVGLEIKREVLSGELSTLDKASLPLFAAVGGMVAPARVYFVINQGLPANLNG